MNPAKPAPAFGTWAPPESPLTIEYSLDVMEQIRAFAGDGLRQLSRGGMETGGVLFGLRGEGSIRITSWRPIACEHARGPAFLLTQNDQLALGQLLQNAKREAELTGMHALGWFVSHTKSGVALTDDDLRIYEHYFPWTWQAALVLHPMRDGSAEAGFFVRAADRPLRAEASYQAFRIEPMVRSQGPHPTVARRMEPPLRRVRLDTAAESAPNMAPNSAHREIPAASAATPSGVPSPRAAARRAVHDRRIWMWAVPAILAIIVLATIVDRNSGPALPPSFGLRVNDAGGELRLEWNKRAQPIRDAVRATLDIRDGPATVPIALDPERLREGVFNYTRKTGDLEVRLTVYPVNGSPVQEIARFVGPPVAQPVNEAATLRRERDGLASEVERLREALRKETARNKQLEDMVRILENRVQVEKLRPAQP